MSLNVIPNFQLSRMIKHNFYIPNFFLLDFVPVVDFVPLVDFVTSVALTMHS